MNEPVIPQDVSINPKEQELAYAISHLISQSRNLGIDDNTVLHGNQSNMYHANKGVIKYAIEIYKIWASLFPHERKEFSENTKFELDTERSVSESLKQGGIFSVSYPERYAQLLHLLMPGVKIQDKRFYKPLIQTIPILKRSNYA